MNSGDPVAVELVLTIRGGDLASLRRLLSDDPALANARIEDAKGGTRTPLHIATDWPGFFPEGPAVVGVLIAAGADPNASVTGGAHTETPLHWAASSDDVEVARALIDGGANLEAPGASIGGGPPLDDAVGYGCWQVARLLVARGARVDRLWHATALGLLDRASELVVGCSSEELNDAFWQACHGGQRRMAEYLLGLGADPNWIPDYAVNTPLDIAGTPDTSHEALVTWLRAQGGRPTGE
jgi:uncharacterized protein